VCPNQAATNDSGGVAVDVTSEDGKRYETVFGFSGQELSELVEKLRDKASKIGIRSAPATNEHPAKALRRMLKEKGGEKNGGD
jgi:hypothetical protein